VDDGEFADEISHLAEIELRSGRGRGLAPNDADGAGAGVHERCPR
jgi:hypothetical protein